MTASKARPLGRRMPGPLLVLLAVIGLAGPGSGAAAERPDLVLVTLDTLRADRIGAYGDPLARTPALDALAARGALFREATTPIPLTLPAHASILSGRYPRSHGVLDNAGFALDASVPLVAESLRDAGYATGAFVSAYVLDGSKGLARGFETYDDGFDAEAITKATRRGLAEHPGSEVVARALDWWRTRSGPRFLWVHLFEAHRPYVPGPEGGDPYRAEVARVDAAVAMLVDAIGAEPVVVVAADHGEALWDEGELEHGLLLTRSVVRVPLVIRPPGGIEGRASAPARGPHPRPAAWVPFAGIGPDGLVLDAVPDAPRAARVIETPVSLVDLVPTLLDFAGLVCVGCEGRSLRGAVEGRELEALPVFSETHYATHHFGWAPAYLVRDAAHRLLRDPAERWTGVVSDPWAQRPLEGEDDARARLADQLDRFMAREVSVPREVDAETRAGLEALGYLATFVTAGEVDPGERTPGTVGAHAPRSGASPPREPTKRARVAERMPLLHRLFLAQARMRSEPVHAKGLLDELVRDAPDLVPAWLSLAQLRANAGDADAALAALDETDRLAPDHEEAAFLRLAVLRGAGRIGAALALVGSRRGQDPDSLFWIRQEIDLHARRGDVASVARLVAEGSERAPGDPYLLRMRTLLRDAGRR
ncbi:MAG: sulfatase [Myxococcales bacterium]|nr:sulfatase [Myxococcales bacterium]